MRYYDLETGIFITRDPLGFIDGPNLYTYVNQNPWSKFDPHGLYVEVTQQKQPNGNIRVNLTLKIMYIPRSNKTNVNPETTAKWNSDIQKTWSGKFGKYEVTTTVIEVKAKDFKKEYRQTTDFEKNELGQGDKIEVKPGSSQHAQKHQYNVVRVADLSKEVGSFLPHRKSVNTEYLHNEGDWNTKPGSVAHEAGHLMGEPDRYYNSEYHRKEWRGNIMENPNGEPDERNISAITNRKFKENSAYSSGPKKENIIQPEREKDEE